MADEVALLRQEMEQLRRTLTQVAPVPRPTQLADPGQIARAPRPLTALTGSARVTQLSDPEGLVRAPRSLTALAEPPRATQLGGPSQMRLGGRAATQVLGPERPRAEEVSEARFAQERRALRRRQNERWAGGEEGADEEAFARERRELRREQNARWEAAGSQRPTTQIAAPEPARPTQLARPAAARQTQAGRPPGEEEAERLRQAEAANPGVRFSYGPGGELRYEPAPAAGAGTRPDSSAMGPPGAPAGPTVDQARQTAPAGPMSQQEREEQARKSNLEAMVQEAQQRKQEALDRVGAGIRSREEDRQKREAAEASKEFRGKVKDAAITFALLSPGLSRFQGLISGTVSGALAGYSAGSLLGPYGAAAGAAAGAGLGFAGDVMRLGASASPQAQATNDQSWELFKTRLATASAADKFLDQSSRSLQAASGGLAGGRGTTRDPLSYLAGMPAPLEMGQRLYRGQSLLDQAGAPEMQAPPLLPGVGSAMGGAMSYEGFAQSFGLGSLNASPIVQETLLEQMRNMNQRLERLVSNTDHLANIVPAWR